MRILLIFPPQGHFTQPFLAVPALQAYLKSQGFDDVHVMDASIEAYDWFLSRERLEESFDRLRRTDRLRTLERQQALRYRDLVDYRRLTQVEVSGEWVVDHIEEAKRTLRSPEGFYDYDRYLRAGRCIEHALAMISAEHHPSDLSAHGFSMRHSVQVTDDILAGAADERENPFLEFFREVTMPKIQALNPDVIGMSLTFTSQAIPVVSLSSMIKAWKPETHVVVGGGLVAYVGDKLRHRPDVFDAIDTLVRLEGERPLTEICHAVAKGGDPDLFRDIPNILYRDRDGVVQRTHEVEPLEIDTLPTPDFEGLPLDRYLSPDFVIPLAITRGCYWGKCVFCTLHKVIGPGYRGRSIERTVDDIRFLKERWGSRYFYFPIEDLPPNMVRRLPDALLEAGLDIEWWCDAKLEPTVFTPETCRKLHDAGCRRLAFGYESASARVLDLMCKGSEPGPGMDVIRRVHDAGISVTLYVMV
ncbi:MAG: cobalamin-dependent protein, partial [Gemmatimonadetes bacterium]|nr:cobalamin-dependent protein [Gemmatimonadota bacterium]